MPSEGSAEMRSLAETARRSAWRRVSGRSTGDLPHSEDTAPFACFLALWGVCVRVRFRLSYSWLIFLSGKSLCRSVYGDSYAYQLSTVARKTLHVVESRMPTSKFVFLDAFCPDLTLSSIFKHNLLPTPLIAHLQSHPLFTFSIFPLHTFFYHLPPAPYFFSFLLFFLSISLYSSHFYIDY